MIIGIIGLGYVGLTLAIAAADCGVTVYGTEVNNHIKECLKRNRAHFYEPGLDKVIAKLNEKAFFCVDTFPEDVKFDAFVVSVGTPLLTGTHSPDFDYIRQALRSISNIYTGEQLVIIRSTVSVGTTRRIALPLLAELCGKPEDEVLIAMCPERTIEGKAIEEITGLPQIISGNNARSVEIADKLFRMITTRTIVVGSLEEAELAKLYCNVYRDTIFAVGNVLCMAAQEFGVDGIKVIRAANDGYARSSIASPGFVAGPCLGKDAYILTNNLPECSAKDFILSERKFNESLEDTVVEWVERNSRGRIVAISGMAFKGKPETSDLRGSSSVRIAKELKKRGYSLRLHDFAAISGELSALELGEVFETVEEVCAGTAALLVLNNNARYSKLMPFSAMFQSGFVILDAWGALSHLEGKGICAFTLGNIKLRREL